MVECSTGSHLAGGIGFCPYNDHNMLTLTLRDRGGDSKSIGIGRGIHASECTFSSFSSFFCRLLTFFKIKFFDKFFWEYRQSVKQFGSRSGATLCRA